MRRRLILEARAGAIHCALLEEDRLAEYFRDGQDASPGKGAVVLGRVERLLPGMEVAFVDIGEDKNAFLPLEKDMPPLRAGEAVICRIEKIPGGDKGKKLNWKLSLPGTYVALLPREPGVRACSAQIADIEEKQRLLAIAENHCPPELGLILRTAAAGRSEAEIGGEIRALAEAWRQMESQAACQRPPRLLWSPGALHRLREALRQQVDQVVYEQALEETLLPLLSELPEDLRPEALAIAEAPTPFARYGVTGQLDKALRRKVWLKSGGFLVFDHPEAFWAIDVNTGKQTGKADLSKTAMDLNREALLEIARQMRLRDMGGILVVDLIDVGRPQRQELLAAMREAVRGDRAKPQVLEISGLCLLQMTRKTLREPLEQLFNPTSPQGDREEEAP